MGFVSGSWGSLLVPVLVVLFPQQVVLDSELVLYSFETDEDIFEVGKPGVAPGFVTVELERLRGLEPLAFCLEGRCSTY